MKARHLNSFVCEYDMTAVGMDDVVRTCSH